MTARGFVFLLCAALLVSGDGIVLAQQEPPAAAQQEKQAPKLSADQIDSLVAPIALYPDPLLSQTLVASTYPLELIQAQQWLKKNSSLKGDALTQAVEKQDWDPSVQAMAAFPDLVKRMTEDITWTTNLGNAFLAQQEDVMDSVQRLRLKAKEAGKLATSEQQTVTTKVVETKTIVVIQPVSTQVVYVPTYSPTVIWGPMYYPYPPIYYPPYYAGAALFTFGVGVAIGASMHGGWGYGCGWGHGGGNTVVINNNNTYVKNSNTKNNVNVNNTTSNWQHNSQHRGGAPYADKSTANKYGGSARGDSMSTRQTQARSGGTGGASNRSASPSNMSSNRSAGSSNFGGSGGGDKVGNRSIPPSSSSRSSGFGGSGSSPSRTSASSARGASSMGSSRSSGASRGGGGGRRR